MSAFFFEFQPDQMNSAVWADLSNLLFFYIIFTLYYLCIKAIVMNIQTEKLELIEWISLLSLTILFLTSCEKYKDFDNLEVTENSFTGTISITESAGDLDGVFNGTGDSGTYTFIWDNPAKGAVLNIDASSSSGGSIQFVLKDSRGNEALNEEISSGESDTFSMDGKKGKWKVKMVFSDLEGDGNFDLNPVN